MADPEFRDVAEKAQLEISPIAGADIQTLMQQIDQAPKATALQVGALTR